VPGIEQALASGAHVDAASPVDGKTALFRAAIFGHAPAVRALLDHGANAWARGNDRATPAAVAIAARTAEKNPDLAHDLDAVITMLRAAEPAR
jgi:ankyrin repeat protein